VVKGANRGGRLLGIPTANILPTDELLPKTGVYMVRVEVDEKSYCGVTNVGYNPTFGEGGLTIETHILSFSENILGKRIKLCFLHRLRAEKTFADVKALTDQIAEDIRQATEWFEKENCNGSACREKARANSR
jgi:riboflavin kinase / FMN adenylyltransferase